MPTLREGHPVPPELAAASVVDAGGAHRPLGESWSHGPCLLSFLRHFGCTGCSEHVTELSPRLLELSSLGVRTVFVGNGAPHFIEGFVARHGLADKGAEVVTDPTLNAFRAAGLTRSAWATFGPRAVADLVRGLTQGLAWAGTQGDNLQQGGSLVVDAQGLTAFYHRSESLGGHARATDLVEVAMRLAAARASVHV